MTTKFSWRKSIIHLAMLSIAVLGRVIKYEERHDEKSPDEKPENEKTPTIELRTKDDLSSEWHGNIVPPGREWPVSDRFSWRKAFTIVSVIGLALWWVIYGVWNFLFGGAA